MHKNSSDRASEQKILITSHNPGPLSQMKVFYGAGQGWALT